MDPARASEAVRVTDSRRGPAGFSQRQPGTTLARVLLRLVAATGARRGEVCALRWSDIDFAKASCASTRRSSPLRAERSSVGRRRERASVRWLSTRTHCDASRASLAQHDLARLCDARVERSVVRFQREPGGDGPLHPDTASHGFSVIRTACRRRGDLHVHSLRHFHATLLDPVVSEKQKQARLGWATAHMARHYTDAIEEEDRRAATHVGRVLSGEPHTVR